MLSDLPYILIFWSACFLVGLIFLPLTISLFRRFVDRGYIFSKVVGIFISSFSLWSLASFGLLSFSQLMIIIMLLFFAIVNFWLIQKVGKRKEKFSLNLKLFAFEEVLFLSTLAFWSYVRGNEPSIRGLEKFMDFGFVNSILRSSHFPPLDMWLAQSPTYSGGAHINYYYFGHYVTAFLTKLTSIDSALTYNLAIAALFAFTFTLSFSIGLNLYHFMVKRLVKGKTFTLTKKHILAGLLTAFLVSLGGNIHPLYAFTSGYPNEAPQPPWELSLGLNPAKYWYPNATRFIPYTIHEFPIYSFVVADLHGHVSDIPFVLLSIALLLSIVVDCKNKDKKEKERKKRSSTLQLGKFLQSFREHTSLPLSKVAFLGVLLASAYMTNAWDGLIYMILAGLVFLVVNLSLQKESILSRLYKTFSASLFLLFFFLVGSLPFSTNFKPFVSGIGVLCAPEFLVGKQIGPLLFEEGKCQRSVLYQLTILWGFFYYNVFSFIIFLLSKVKGALLKKSKKGKRSLNYLITHLLNYLSPADIFVFLMMFVSTLLLAFPEFFYVKDIYPAHYRANTMFKLGYQAFIMLSISSAYVLFRIKSKVKKRTALFVYGMFFFIQFFLVAIYPYFAINSYYGRLKTYQGLDGLSWMQKQYPDDYEAISWLRENINCEGIPKDQCNNQPVIVEANGDSYTDYARVSANTGLPTIIGWPVHEWLWRGSYDEAGRRIPEVQKIYESEDVEEVKTILDKYNAEFIFVGTLEREKYPNIKEEKLNLLGDVVFESGETKIYRVD